jgi:arginyl-tRNA synthetase
MMKPAMEILEERLSQALGKATGADFSAAVRPATDAKFGDYQANGVMGAAKKLKCNPRDLAAEVVRLADLSDICEKPEIAGPGFINLRLRKDYIASALLEINRDSSGRLGISKISSPRKVVVDYSGPNIAKEMHVGQLRSTILGDCMARMLEFQGHKVIRQNHIGDWGTQFGRVILGLWHLCMAREHGGEYYLSELDELKGARGDKERMRNICMRIRERHEEDWRSDSDIETGDGKRCFEPFLKKLLEDCNSTSIWQKFLLVYQYVSLLEDSCTGMGLDIPIRGNKTVDYGALSRHVTSMLQRRADLDEQEWKAWDFARKLTLSNCESLYGRLGVTLTRKDVRGESEYKDVLGEVVAEMQKTKIAIESDGAICVFPPGFKNKEGEPLPFMIRKSDGAFLYATTDLAALRYRLKDLGADRVLYLTDARQKLHFEMLFAVVRMAGWVNDKVELAHVMFGSVMGEDGKPFKTRSGESVKLAELLDEAVTRARAVVEEKNPELSEELKGRIANAVGIGAIKYADYSNNLTSDYVFSFDRMLAMEGNTAPYMQYAYARVKSIERKAVTKEVDIASELASVEKLSLEEPTELELAKHLLRYGEVIASAAADYRPNYLTAYLYELASKFSAFYYACPVLQADAEKRPTRLMLCDLAARTIRHGLTELLGIEVVEQM